LEGVGEVVDDPSVEVVAAEVRVARGRPYLDDAIADVKDAHVEGAATEIEYEDGLVSLLVEPVRQRGRGRLVDDAKHIEARDPAGVLGRLSLRVIEVGRDGDDGLGDPLAEELRRVLRELAQYKRGDLLRCVELVADLESDRVVWTRYDVISHRVDL